MRTLTIFNLATLTLLCALSLTGGWSVRTGTMATPRIARDVVLLSAWPCLFSARRKTCRAASRLGEFCSLAMARARIGREIPQLLRSIS